MMPLPLNVVSIKPTAKPQQQRASKMVARPVVSSCLTCDLPETGKKVPTVVKWRRAVLSDDGPRSSTTRLVLLTLASHMDANGEKCFPSHEALAAETRLSVRAVFNHLKLARAEQWFRITEKPGRRSGWKLHEYTPTVPTFRDEN